MRPIDELNHLSGSQFREALRPLFEAAAPLADALEARKPYQSYADLLDHAERLLADMPEARQVEVLAAHPRIGERPASEASFREQGYDGEPDDPAVLDQLAQLNRAYELQFGFRFVAFVNRRARSEIVPVLRQRLANRREVELATARREMLAIARDRLKTLA